MGRIGFPETVVILAIVFLVFGTKKLPDLARGLGQAIRGFKDAVKEGEEPTAANRRCRMTAKRVAGAAGAGLRGTGPADGPLLRS